MKKTRAMVCWMMVAVPILLMAAPGAGNAGRSYYVDASRGDDNSDGNIAKPWKTLEKAVPSLRKGDTLYLRGGTFYDQRIRIAVRGTKSAPITIRNFPGAFPVLDGGLPAFRKAPNQDWEPFDAQRRIYRSTAAYPGANCIYGYFSRNGELWRMVPYESYGHLASDNEDYTDRGNIYIGPGVFWNDRDRKIYIRLKATRQQLSMGFALLPSEDPRQTRLFLFPRREGLLFDGGAFIHLGGLTIRFYNNAIKFQGGAHDVTVGNCAVLGGRSHILVRPGVHDLTFDRIRIDDRIPPWVSWTDVKSGTRPGHQLQGAAILLDDRTWNIEIRKCRFTNTWDGIDATRVSHGIHIHHNFFSGIRDDVVQLGSGSYDIEINNNRMINVSKGISRDGSGAPRKIGTKFIHHNIIDCGRMLGGRSDPDNLLSRKYHGDKGDGMVQANPFGRHRIGNLGAADPWKIYNNTILFGKDLNNIGIGYTYNLAVHASRVPHEVYNNVFIQREDHWIARGANVADGSQVCDGNLYFRSAPDPQTPLFKSFKGDDETIDFRSLDEFKRSRLFKTSRKFYSPGWEHDGIEADPRLNRRYCPAEEGAASGGIELPAAWPGTGDGKYRGALAPSDCARMVETPEELKIDAVGHFPLTDIPKN